MVAARGRNLFLLVLLMVVSLNSADESQTTVGDVAETTAQFYDESTWPSTGEVFSDESTTIAPEDVEFGTSGVSDTTTAMTTAVDDLCPLVQIHDLHAELNDSHSVKLNWSIDDPNSCLKQIEISHENSTVSISPDASVYTFRDLPQCHRYRFSVRTVNSQGLASVPNSVEVPIFNVTVSYPSTAEAKISWRFMPGFEECTSSVTVGEDRFNRTGIPVDSMLISGLKMCNGTSRYDVVAHTNGGWSFRQIVNVSYHWQSLADVKVQSNVIQWTYPVEGLGCVSRFRLRQSIPLKGLSEEGFLDVTDKNSDGKFSFELFEINKLCGAKVTEISAIYNYGIEGEPLVMEIQSEELKQVENIVVNTANGRYVMLNWKKPVSDGTCLKEYKVSYWNRTETISADEQSFVSDELDACQAYNFTIMVIDLDGKISSQVVESVTIREESISKVTDLELFEHEAAMWIKWTRPAESPHCIGSYQIKEWFYDSENHREVHVDFSVQDQLVQLNITDACSLSSISVTPVSKSGLQGAASTISLRNSVEQLRIVNASANSVNITWSPPTSFPDCVTHYLVYRKGLTEPIANTTSLFVTIPDLKPCKSYTFEVVPVNRYQLRHSPNEVTYMLEEHISAVQQVVERDEWIQWHYPRSGAGCISQFLVTRRSVDDGEIISNSTISVDNVTTRKTDSDVFRFPKSKDVCALRILTEITPLSFSGTLGEPKDLIKPRPVPGPVRDVRVSTDVEREVTITWLKPLLHPECVSLYRISYEDRNVTIPGNETTITIQNLNSCVEYNFTVAPVDFSGQDVEGVTVNATVKEVPMSGVQDFELIEVDPRSLSAKWKPPLNGTYCAVAYRYVVWTTTEGGIAEQISNSTTDTHITFPEVFACAMYSVQVIPVSATNKDGNNEIAEIVTKERVMLRYHIDPVRLKQKLATSLELQTSLTTENNNLCQLLSVRFTCRTDDVPEGEEPKVIVGESPITDQKGTFDATVSGLLPFNAYNCSASILNIAGWSDETALVGFTTDEDIPEHPRNLQLVGGSNSIVLTWSSPKVKNGIITRYRVHIRSEGARYPTPSYCALPEPYNNTFDLHEDDDNVNLFNWDNEDLDHTIQFLRPYTDYVIQVAAATKAGLGPYTEMVSVSTLPQESEPVYEFSEVDVTLPEIDKPYNSSVFISWKLPCQLNGRLRGFMGQFVGNRSGLEHTLDWSRPVDPSAEIVETYTFIEPRLEPEFTYIVSIMILVDNVANHSEPKFLTFQSPAGIPEIRENVSWGSVNVMDAPNPTKTAKISLSDIIFESNVGSITYVALLVSERICQEDPHSERSLSNEWPDIRSWSDVASMPCTAQYQTTPKEWNPIQQRKRRGRSDEEIMYVIGSESCVNDQEYCNGPLKPGTEYALIVRVFTQSGYSDSTLKIFRTDSLIRLTLIISSVLGCLVVAFALGFAIIYRRYQKQLLPTQTTLRSPNEEPADIPLKSFSSIYEELVQCNREKIIKEYQAINYFSEQFINEKVTFFAAKENDKKNRYLGILPFDGNRVPLDHDDLIGDEDEEVNDYINASFVDGYKYQREYIATQGPKAETSFDFWRMILQYEVESIVMLTQTVENERIKCYQYFPRFNQTVRFRDVTVKCTQEMNLTFYQKRLMIVTRNNISKAVFHYHFLTWPDHGCPSTPGDLMRFIKIVRSERKNPALPVVVHCSAGVGRTGTFIALDIILQRIQQEKKINIYDTVKQLRRQRVKMVQTSEQYAFLYQSCLEYTTRKKKPKTSNEETTINMGHNQIRGNTAAGGKRRNPLINIKFPKYVHSGISNVKSYAPDDVESHT